MTNQYSPPNRSVIDLEPVVPWVNVSGEEIPAFGVIQLRQNFDETSKADKPNSTSGLFFVNGPVLVRSEADTTGESYLWDKPRRVLLAADVTVGDEVGPSEGSWEMSSDGNGWRVLRQAISGIGVVLQTGGGGSGGGHEIWFEILSVTCEADGTKVLYCEVTDYNGGCDQDVPGTDEYGNVEVVAKCSEELDAYPVEWLEAGGRVGRATWFFPRGAEYCEARWLLDKICGSPQCGAN